MSGWLGCFRRARAKDWLTVHIRVLSWNGLCRWSCPGRGSRSDNLMCVRCLVFAQPLHAARRAVPNNMRVTLGLPDLLPPISASKRTTKKKRKNRQNQKTYNQTDQNLRPSTPLCPPGWARSSLRPPPAHTLLPLGGRGLCLGSIALENPRVSLSPPLPAWWGW